MSYRDWIVLRLKDSDYHPKIESAVPLGDSLIEILSEDGKMIMVGVIESKNITSVDIHKLCKGELKKPNMLIAKFESIWDGSAIDYARQHNMGWGGVGDIVSAIYSSNYADIQKREYVFVETNLLKHTKVKRLERLYDRVFKIHRINELSPITIILINSYELSGDDVRNARDKYGEFDAILKTNPNGYPTGLAYSAAEEIGVEIFKWGELLGRLNKR